MKKRILSLFLALIMICSLAACGGDGTANKGNETNNTASKEGVFEVTEMTSVLESVDLEQQNCYIRQIKAIDDMIYMTVDSYYDTGSKLLYLSADMDGNVKSHATIYEESWEKYGVDEDFGVDAAAAVVVEPAVMTTEITDENVEEYHSVYQYFITSNGRIAYVDSLERYGDGISESICQVVVCDTDGTELSRINLSELVNSEEIVLYVNRLLDSGEGTILALSSEKVFEISLDGELLGTYDTTDVTQNLYNVGFYKDGKPVFATWNDDWTEQTYNVIDLKNGVKVEELDLMDTMSNFSIYDGTNSGYDLVLTDRTAVYGYNFGDTEPTKIMDYINSNLATYGINSICFKDSEHFIGMYSDVVNYDNHLASFKKVAPENVPDRTIMTIATYGSDTELTKAIIDFNQASDKYKILMEDYSKYATNEDWYAGMTRLDNDIVSGKIPDIIQGNQALDITKYATKGLLADFYELMDKDDSINRADYAENVFTAYEVDGKLYELPIKFYVNTVYGKTAIWGTETGITWDEVAAVQAKYPEAKLFADMTKDTALRESFRYSYSQFVDPVTGTCHFDSDAFRKLLEYANTYPETINYDEIYNDDNYWLSYQTQYMEDKTLLCSATIYSLYDGWLTSMNNFNEEVTPVGFPTDEGAGNGITALQSYMISAKSKNVEGAWEFIKTFLTEEYQYNEEGSNYSWGLPILKKGLEGQMEYIMQKPYYYDGEGNKVEYENVIYIGNEAVEIEPATREEAQKWYDFVLSVNTKSSTNFDKALEIIAEEAAAYFSGQKRVEEVTSIIQSRMNIFISESQ